MSILKIIPSGGGGGSVQLKAPASTATNSDIELTLPSDIGSNTQVMKLGSVSSKAGTLSFADGGKILQYQYTKTWHDTAWSFPTSEADLASHSISMTKKSSGSSKYIFNVNWHGRWQAQSANAKIKIFKGASCIDSDMDSNNGLGYIHAPTQNMNMTLNQRWVDTAATDTYKLRVIANTTDMAIAADSWWWFEIWEVE